MSEGESTNESSRRFPFRAVLAVSDGLLALACLVAFGIVLALLPSLKQLNISSNLAPFMNGSALTCALLIPTIAFAAAAFMLLQKSALSRIGAKIGTLSDVLMLVTVAIIFWLAIRSPYVPALPESMIVAFILYAMASVLLLAIHIWYIANTRDHATRGRAIGQPLLLVSGTIDVIIVFAFILLHWGTDSSSFTDFGQHWLPAMALHILYDSNGLSLGYVFQVFVLLVSAILLISGSRQYILIGCIGAVASFTSTLLPFVLTLHKALDYDPFWLDRTQPAPYIGIDVGFIVQAGVLSACLLLLHIIVLVRNLDSSKTVEQKAAHNERTRWKHALTARLERVKESAKKVHAGLLLGAILSGILGLALTWLGLTRKYVLVLGSMVFPTMPFFIGLFFLIICVILFMTAYRKRVPKRKRSKLVSGICWAIVTPFIILSFLFTCMYVAEAPEMTRISSDDPSKERTVALGYPRFPHHTHADIYTLDPYSIIAYRTSSIIDYEKSLGNYM